MNENIRRDILPTIRTAFFIHSGHTASNSMTEHSLIYDIVETLRNTPYEYMLYMAMIESLDGLEEYDKNYARSVECFYEGVFRE